MRSLIALGTASALVALGAPVRGAETTPEDLAAAAATVSADAGDSQETVIVKGERPSYGVAHSATATKTDTPVKDIPQAMTVVTEAQINDQALRTMSELLTFVPGATPGTGEGNRDQMTLRGNNSTADFFIDGVRDDVQYFRDFYNVERVEILKGPNAMIFGRGGGGGIVNRVVKRAGTRPHRAFAVLGDSQGGLRLTGDVGQPLASGLGLRVNGVYENGESFRRHVNLERYAVNPTLGWSLGADTRLDLAYEYLHDRRTADRGLPSQSDGVATSVDQPVEGFDRSFFGDPDESFSKADVHLATLAVEHRFSDSLTLRNRTMFGDYDKFYRNIYPTSAVSATGMVTLSAYDDTTTRRNLFSQTDLIWESRLGGIDQTLLLGFELGGSKGRNQRRNGVFSTTSVGPSTITVPVNGATVDVPVTYLANGNNARVETGIAAIYAQDQLRPTDWLEIVAGLRFDRIKVDVLNRASGATFERTDELWSPRLGLIVKPRPNLSFYASYSRSYLPASGDQFSGLSLTTEALKPERFDNYEIGAKWEPVPGLLATLAAYQLDRANTQARDPANPQLTVLTGEQRSKGIELGLERSINDRWLVSAGYAFQEAEITKTTTAAPAGRDVPLVPRHSFSLWSRYQASERLGFGVGLLARSKSSASLSNLVELPGYTRVDAAVFYQIREGIDAQLNVENLFDSDYFPTAHNDNNIAPGAPLTVKGALRFGF